MASIQLNGVAPEDAVDEFGNPLNPQDKFGLPLYPPPTPDQLRSPNPINWPTRAPGQAPLFDNPLSRAIAAGTQGPLRTAPLLPNSVRNFTLPPGIDTSEGANVGQQPGQNLQPYTPSEMAAPITSQKPPWVGGGSAAAAPATPGTTLTSVPPSIPMGMPGRGIPPQPLPAPGAQARPTSTGAMPQPLPAPGAQARPTSAGAMPPRGAPGGGGGSRIPPQSVNLGYGAPGVGHYVPTTGVGRGPGTWVPGGGGTIPPMAPPAGPLAARGGTVNLPTSYRLPSGARVTPQGNVIP